MTRSTLTHRSRFAAAIFEVLNPIPYGYSWARSFFGVTYAVTGNVFWGKSAAWLVSVALFFAIIPRLINPVRVWITARRTVTRVETVDFWLNLFGIVAAILNAFVHSRDAYAMVPDNVILSVVTVAPLSIAQLALGFAKPGIEETPRA